MGICCTSFATHPTCTPPLPPLPPHSPPTPLVHHHYHPVARRSPPPSGVLIAVIFSTATILSLQNTEAVSAPHTGQPVTIPSPCASAMLTMNKTSKRSLSHDDEGEMLTRSGPLSQSSQDSFFGARFRPPPHHPFPPGAAPRLRLRSGPRSHPPWTLGQVAAAAAHPAVVDARSLTSTSLLLLFALFAGR